MDSALVSSNPDLNNTLTVAGGTSFGAPTFAGIVALINQKMGSPQGFVNPTLYAMAASTPAAFHDITIGNNIVPCEVVSTDTGCPASGEMGYSARIGYDQASGLGSIDAYNLVTAWSSSTSGNLPAPTLSAPANGAIGVVVSPNFTWTQVIGNAGYRIMIATSPADLPANPATSTCSACTVVDTTSTNSNSYTPPSALAVGAYYWQVQALEPSSSSGTAAWSNAFSFTTAGGTLAAPTLTAPANGATGVSTTPTFSWTTVTGNAGYRILIATTQALLERRGLNDPHAAHKSCGRDLRRLHDWYDDHGRFLYSCCERADRRNYLLLGGTGPGALWQRPKWGMVECVQLHYRRCGFLA